MDAKEIKQGWLSDIDSMIAVHETEIKELRELRQRLVGEIKTTTKAKRTTTRRRKRTSSNGKPSSEETRTKVMTILTSEPMTGQAIARQAGMSESSIRSALSVLVREGKAQERESERKPGQMGKTPVLFVRASESAQEATDGSEGGAMPSNRFARSEALESVLP